MENVVVVGASANEGGYSNKAMKMLAEYGHKPIPVAPAAATIPERRACSRVADVADEVDTVTLYVGVARQQGLFEQIVDLKLRRVIFNPGTENPDAYEHLRTQGIEVIEGCTLVMLKTGQF